MPDVPEGYDLTVYDRPSVTVDVVIFSLRDQDLLVLLIRRKHPPFAGYWAIPGGFVQINESLESAALRELEEETGVRDVYIEQLYTFGAPGRDPRTRVITVAYLALLPSTALPPLHAGDDAADAQWWSSYDLPPLAFDHAKILEYALIRLRYKLEYTAVGFELLPELFTLSELQSAYEIILGEKLGPGQLSKKAAQGSSGGTHPPAPRHRRPPGPSIPFSRRRRGRGQSAALVSLKSPARS